MTILSYGRVPPFGYLWINARFQLPKAFRRIPRPSSPLTAKASTVCASLLDHITSAYSRSYYKPIAFLNRSANISLRFCYLNLYLIFNEPLDNPDEITLYQIISSALSLPHSYRLFLVGGVGEDRTPDPLRARQVLSQLSYDPLFLRRLFALLFVASVSRSVTYSRMLPPLLPSAPRLTQKSLQKNFCFHGPLRYSSLPRSRARSHTRVCSLPCSLRRLG